MKFANASFSLLLGLMTCCTVLAEEKAEFFSQSPIAKVDGVQFSQKSDSIKPQADDNPPLHVSCWQNGVLIVDESNWQSPQMQSRFVAMKPLGSSETGLYLVDFNNTFCMLKKR